MPRTSLDLVPTAARSLHSILEIADHVAPGGLRREVATTVKGLFDLLAWSDGSLDADEIALLDRLCEEVPDFRELCEAHDIYEPTDPTFGEIPALLTAVVAHDRRTGERLTPLLVTSLEALGYAVIGAGSVPIDVEKSELRVYVDGLRNIARLLATAPTDAEPVGLKA